MRKIKDLSGQVFNNLSVLSFAFVKGNHSYWNCRCSCGLGAVIRTDRVQKSTVCTCFWRNILPTSKRTNRKEYLAWRQMVYRCTNPNHHNYKWYGAKGVTICERWINSFENFLSDIGPAPSAEYSLERIEVSKGYTPENCKWATFIEQMNNKTDTRYVVYNGIKKGLSVWCRELNLKYHRTLHMLNKGMKLDEIISLP